MKPANDNLQSPTNDREVVDILVVAADPTARSRVESVLPEGTRKQRYQIRWASDLQLPEGDQSLPHTDIVIAVCIDGSVEQLKQHWNAQPSGRLPQLIYVGDENKLDTLRDVAFDCISFDELSAALLKRSIRFSLEHRTITENVKQHWLHFRDVVQSNADGMLVVDSDGVIKFVNPAAEQLLSRPASHLVESTFGLPLVNDQSTEITIHRPDHRVGTAELRLVNITWENSPAVLVSLRDITLRKQRERQLLENQLKLRTLATELAHSEQRERQRLAHILHDDLQQVLVAAKMQLSRVHTQPDRIDDAVKRTAGAMDEAIAISRSLTGELSPAILHDGGLAAALEWLGRNAGERHGLKVDVDADPSLNPTSEQMNMQLFQMARELLFNIVKHAQTETARIKLSDAPNERIHLTIEDDGIGFDAESMDYGVGESFGLYHIQQRAAVWGATIDIHSKPGEGCRVVITAERESEFGEAPLSRIDGSFQEPQRVPTKPISLTRVMIVEDHAIVRHGIIEILRESPSLAVIAEAGDGDTALMMARSLKPDLVLMDISMPALNGIETARQMTKELPGTKVIGLSMHESREIGNAMRNAGASAYVCKRKLASDLLETIDDVLASESN